jgi:hypothetical protein
MVVQWTVNARCPCHNLRRIEEAAGLYRLLESRGAGDWGELDADAA